jgi:hypothetical protein
MDFADTTIVCLATETGIQNIVTFDKKDFAIAAQSADIFWDTDLHRSAGCCFFVYK